MDHDTIFIFCIFALLSTKQIKKEMGEKSVFDLKFILSIYLLFIFFLPSCCCSYLFIYFLLWAKHQRKFYANRVIKNKKYIYLMQFCFASKFIILIMFYCKIKQHIFIYIYKKRQTLSACQDKMQNYKHGRSLKQTFDVTSTVLVCTRVYLSLSVGGSVEWRYGTWLTRTEI